MLRGRGSSPQQGKRVLLPAKGTAYTIDMTRADLLESGGSLPGPRELGHAVSRSGTVRVWNLAAGTRCPSHGAIRV
jgi:hypothetical protein